MAVQCFVEGNGKIKLTETDFVAVGNTSRLYACDRIVYKIYNNANSVLPIAKIHELAKLDHPYIIYPQALLFDKKQVPLGFTMRQVQGASPLARLFDFKNQQHMGVDKILGLLAQMIETITFIHAQHCLMVDGNEMNYLVKNLNCPVSYFVGVDSYQTPNFPATMLSTYDYHSKEPSTLTDWFAFAIIACQLLVGIHPYKGRHPQFDAFDLSARMRANMSIFNKEVSLPATVRDFSVIPKSFYDWFVRLFEKGERLPPPPITTTKIATFSLHLQTIQDTNHFIFSLLKQFDGPIKTHRAYRGIHTVIVGQRVFVDTNDMIFSDPNMHVVYAPETFVPLAAGIRNDRLHIENLQLKQPLAVNIHADHLLSVANTLYVVCRDQLIAVKITYRDNKLLVSKGKSWRIMPHAYQILEGLLYQDVLGKPYLIIPCAKEICLFKAIPELIGYRIISGKYDKGVVMLIGYKQGRYDQIIIYFNEKYTKYNLRLLENKEVLDNNFVTLDDDVVVHIPHDGELIIFHRYTDMYKSILDSQIHTAMRLSHKGNRILFHTDNRLYNVEMRST